MNALRLLSAFVLVGLAANIAVTGCSSALPKVPSAFHEMLDPEFVMPKRSELSKEEVAQILSAFVAHRRPNEFVVSIQVSSPSQAALVVRMTHWMHGDGSAHFQKKDGVWVYEATWYPV